MLERFALIYGLIDQLLKSKMFINVEIICMRKGGVALIIIWLANL